MKLDTFSYTRGAGWSEGAFPALDHERTLVLAFAAPEYFHDPDPIRELAARYPRSHVVGCSSAGEIFGDQVVDGSLAVAVARLDRGTLARAFVPISTPAESQDAGERLGRLLSRDGLQAVLVLCDGILVNGSELVRGLNAVLPPGVVVTGGLAGDGDRFQRTWIIHGGKLVSGGISAIGFYGASLLIGHGCKGGWDVFGPERVITRSEGNVLYELDGEPALALYCRYLGNRAAGLPATGLLFPLALRPERAHDKMLVRTVLAIDHKRQSMTFAGDIPQGARSQFMRANLDRLVDGAAIAAQRARTAADGAEPSSPTLSIAISCVGRRLVLGERTEEEVEAVLDALPLATGQVGFYSYGEISTYAAGVCDLHNQTMTLTTIREA